jgi:hypothetical protein
MRKKSTVDILTQSGFAIVQYIYKILSTVDLWLKNEITYFTLSTKANCSKELKLLATTLYFRARIL